MKTIYKYPIASNFASFNIPADAQILCVQLQNDIPHIWALIDYDSPLVTRSFQFYVTGQDMPDNSGTYIGTVQQGWFVSHLFEETQV